MSLRDLPGKELTRRYHALRTEYADVKREIERRKQDKKRQRDEATRTRAPG